MRLVFAGTPEFSVPCLEACRASGAEVVAVYTQPDRPAGRGRKLTPSPVKQAALAAGIPVEQPESLKSRRGAARRWRRYQADLMVVVAYGLILPRKVLAMPRLGCWNVHASLLPRWRGAAPIQRAILAGDAESGVDLMQMEAGLDTGPVLLQRRTPITARRHRRLAARPPVRNWAPRCSPRACARVAGRRNADRHCTAGRGRHLRAQAGQGRGTTRFQPPGEELERQVRAFDPWPVAEGRDRRRARADLGCAARSTTPHARAPGEIVGRRPRRASTSPAARACCASPHCSAPAASASSARDYLNARPDLRPRAMKSTPDTRALAARGLAEVALRGASLREVMERSAPRLSDPRDRALLMALLSEGARWWLRFDAAVDGLLAKPIRHKDPAIHALLVLGLVQLEVLQLQDYAAVAATVEATRTLKRPQLAGLVNAVLRRWQRERDSLIAQLDAKPAHPPRPSGLAGRGAAARLAGTGRRRDGRRQPRAPADAAGQPPAQRRDNLIDRTAGRRPCGQRAPLAGRCLGAAAQHRRDPPARLRGRPLCGAGWCRPGRRRSGRPARRPARARCLRRTGRQGLPPARTRRIDLTALEFEPGGPNASART